jgi:hypothetical protein
VADDHRHDLLVPPAVRAEWSPQHRQVVLPRRFPERGPRIRRHREIADPVNRVLIDHRRFLPAEDLLHPIQRGQRRLGAFPLIGRAVHPGKGPERPVMDHVRIGDRQHDVNAAHPGALQNVLQVVNPWRPVLVVLRVHPVIGHHPNHVPTIEQFPEQFVKLPVEPIRHLAARRLGVLHEVGRREIHQIERPDLLRDGNADLQAVGAHVPLVRPRILPPDQPNNVVNSVLRNRVLVRLLGTGRRHAAVRQHPPQFVLRRHTEHPRPRPPHLRVDRRRAKKPRLAELDLLAVRRQIMISRHPMHDRRPTRHDREVVDVGQRRHLRPPAPVTAAVRQHVRQPRHEPARERVVEIARIGAVHRDDGGRAGRRSVVAGVDSDRLSGHRVRASPRPQPRSPPVAVAGSGAADPSCCLVSRRQRTTAAAPAPSASAMRSVIVSGHPPVRAPRWTTTSPTYS